MTNHRSPQSTTLYRQLTKTHLTVAFLVLLISTLTSIGFDVFVFMRSINQNLRSTANILVRIIEPALVFMDKPEAIKDLTLLQSEPAVTGAELYDSSGLLYASYGTPIDLASQVKTTLASQEETTLLSGKNIYYLRPIVQNMNTIGLLIISASTSVVLKEHLNYLWVFILVIIIISILAALLSRIASTFISNPITKVSDAVKQISTTGNYSIRISSDSDSSRLSEIVSLATEFNKMIDQIQLKDQEILSTNNELERKVEKRTEELKISQKMALENAHSAGMSEIATGVLHNIGNIMNSVNISVEEIEKTIRNSKLDGLQKAVQMISENKNQLSEFLATDPKGKALPEYLSKISPILQTERGKITEEITGIGAKLKIVENVIHTQQDYAGKSLFTESLPGCEIVDEILQLSLTTLARHNIHVEKNYLENVILKVQKVKFAHILVNLIKNAKEAMLKTDPNERVLKVEVGKKQDLGSYVSISDTGEGIEATNLERIFGHGFTTKEEGHGFGLHFCANAMTEMGGKLLVESPGPGRGATFTLLFQETV